MKNNYIYLQIKFMNKFFLSFFQQNKKKIYNKTNHTNVSILLIVFSLSLIFKTGFSVVVVIAGNERRRSHRRWIGWEDFIDDKRNV